MLRPNVRVMPAPQRPPIAYQTPTGNTRRSFAALGFLSALVGVPAVLILGSSWYEVPRAVPGDNRPLPEWITPGDVRANTRDGTLVRVRVALDAGTSRNKSAVERHLREVGQVLEISVGERKTSDLYGSKGIQRLASDMLARVNQYLDAEGIDHLNAVAIQDLWYTRPET
jgi:flagellar basal body-associated protein FliL